MSEAGIPGWELLRHGGLLLDPVRASRIGDSTRPALYESQQIELRKQTASLLDGGSKASDFVRYVLEKVCGFGGAEGSWLRGTDVGTEWGRRLATGDMAKPRLLWQGHKGATLPIFLEDKTRAGQGRRAASQVVQWLRTGNERLALLTSGAQWRLIYVGLDADAWCEWDAGLWLEEGTLSPQVDALRTLIQPALWTPAETGMPSPLLQAILDSRKGQAELSAVLGDRVREAVETLIQAHGDALREHCADVPSADIYRAAVRVVMRMVVVLFAESRELLPRDNALYQGAYGLNGLRDELDKSAARGGNRLSRSWNAWPRVLSLFRLVHAGSHHEALPVPEYGGELFQPAEAKSHDGLTRALCVFETAALDHEVFPDRDVHKVLGRITTTRVKVRQGHSATWVAAPVDFSDLSSEYIGILYEGLLDFELKTAPAGDPVIFLAVGNQPALPLSRLEQMDDKALKSLLEKLKDTSKKTDDDAEGEEDGEPEVAGVEAESDEPASEEAADDADTPSEEEASQDERQVTRTRAETWARSAALAGGLVKKPKGSHTAQKQVDFEEALGRKAKQLVVRVILPGEWYVVRWGGTRKGSGTFYTRPGLAVPTTHRTLWPLAYAPPVAEDGTPDLNAPHAAWAPRKPEEILALKVCDPGCGSGTFPVAALRFLTDALFRSLHHHGRVKPGGDHVVMHLLQAPSASGGTSPELLGEERLPCRPEDPSYEPRMKATLRRYVVERCIYGVDLDPLAVELCRLALWVETMDRTLPFSFLDHKVKCGNSLVGAWFDQFQHYPLMAWKGREGGDKGHNNGVHFKKDERGKALREFTSEKLKLDIATFLRGRNLFSPDLMETAGTVHAGALATLSRLHDLPVQDTAERARIYRVELIEAPAYRALRAAMDLWCACWFWPADDLAHAPLPTTFTSPSAATLAIATEVSERKRFFHWELEFPDVFRAEAAGFDAILGNPPWDIAKPNSKEFFSNIDPLYRAYGKQEAIAHQKAYFQKDEVIERAWIDYNADFRSQSNFVGSSASPFGDPINKDAGWDSFSIESGKKNAEVHERWRQARRKTRGFADAAHPFRHQGSADLNLYKAFLEQAHALLRTEGRLGFIVPSGLYSDHGTGHLRRLFLDHCRWEWLFGFENREKVFDIDSRFKFNPIIVEKGGQTAAIRTAFMRRKLEDWERAEDLATPYARAQVDRFSPRSKSILEIQSKRDLEILEKIYSNSVLLGDQGPDGWGITYSTEFHMTNDSTLFPPRTKWEELGYKPDEYSRWLKGTWRPIADLWKELGVDPTRIVPIDPECEKEIARLGAEVQRTPFAVRCAQPPYDTLPIPRADIPAGIILSRSGGEWVPESGVEDVALPLYEGRMVGQFDYSKRGWVSGKGRAAVWRDIGWNEKRIEPQYLMALSDSLGGGATGPKVPLMNISSATNSRTVIAAFTKDYPCNHSLNPLRCTDPLDLLSLQIALNSFAVDFQARVRLGGLNLSFFVLDEVAGLKKSAASAVLASLGARLGLVSTWFSPEALRMGGGSDEHAVKARWSLGAAERCRVQVIGDCVVAALAGLGRTEVTWLLRDTDMPGDSVGVAAEAKGFWRVDKDKDPELRQTLLTLVAFRDLEERIKAAGGDRDKGIQLFLTQNKGEGWMLPETLRLADYGLGHDDRAQHPQPVARRLGPRFYDWQLAQTAEESWRECRLHARNLLGEASYKKLLADIEAGRNGVPSANAPAAVAEPVSRYQARPQGKLFD